MSSIRTYSNAEESTYKGLSWALGGEATITTGQTVYWGLKTPASGITALDSRDLYAKGEDTLYQLYENLTYTGGTNAGQINYNRAYQADTARRPMAEFKSGVTVTPDPAKLFARARLMGDRKALSVASPGGERSYFLLPDTYYVLGITNSDVQDAIAGFAAVFRKLGYSFP